MLWHFHLWTFWCKKLNYECDKLLLTSLSFRVFIDEVVGTPEEERSSFGEVEMPGNHESFCTRQTNQDLKEMLLKKYSGYLSSLKKEFLKKRKKEKLPKDARMALFDWWNTHYKWPYPTVISIPSQLKVLHNLKQFVKYFFFNCFDRKRKNQNFLI